jgi:hypothetical protein
MVTRQLSNPYPLLDGLGDDEYIGLVQKAAKLGKPYAD